MAKKNAAKEVEGVIATLAQAGISQLSDFTPQSYPNEPLDSSETTSLAVIPAHLPAQSGQSRL